MKRKKYYYGDDPDFVELENRIGRIIKYIEEDKNYKQAVSSLRALWLAVMHISYNIQEYLDSMNSSCYELNTVCGYEVDPDDFYSVSTRADSNINYCKNEIEAIIQTKREYIPDYRYKKPSSERGGKSITEIRREEEAIKRTEKNSGKRYSSLAEAEAEVEKHNAEVRARRKAEKEEKARLKAEKAKCPSILEELDEPSPF